MSGKIRCNGSKFKIKTKRLNLLHSPANLKISTMQANLLKDQQTQDMWHDPFSQVSLKWSQRSTLEVITISIALVLDRCHRATLLISHSHQVATRMVLSHPSHHCSIHSTTCRSTLKNGPQLRRIGCMSLHQPLMKVTRQCSCSSRTRHCQCKSINLTTKFCASKESLRRWSRNSSRVSKRKLRWAPTSMSFSSDAWTWRSQWWLLNANSESRMVLPLLDS